MLDLSRVTKVLLFSVGAWSACSAPAANDTSSTSSGSTPAGTTGAIDPSVGSSTSPGVLTIASDTGVTGDGSVDGGAGQSADDGGITTGGPTDEIDWTHQFDLMFPQDHVVEIRLDFAPGEWEQMVSAGFAKQYHPAALTFDGDPLDEIGVRLKGFSSLVFAPGEKLPLKLDFNRYGGPRLYEIDKLNLNNNVYDVTLMRERLTGRAYRALQVHAPRTAYARLFVDDRDIGVYTLVQAVDKRFLKERFGTDNDADDGNLYKCIWSSEPLCDLSWRNDQPSDYPRMVGTVESGLVLKTNKDDPSLNDYSDLIALLDVINNSTDDEFASRIQATFEVDSFLRLAAVTIALSSYDSYFNRLANFYLYHRPDTDRFEMIAWDMNMSYGSYPCRDLNTMMPLLDVITGSIKMPLCQEASGIDIPLATRILAVPEFFEQYLAYVDEVVATVLTTETQNEWIGEFEDLIAPEVLTDPNLSGPFEMESLREFASARAAAIATELANSSAYSYR